MIRNMFLLLTGLVLFTSAHAGDVVSTGESLQDTVAYLISTVSSADLVFIRNGDEHTPAEAAEHMQRKYEHFLKKDEIKTPEDFIRLSASKSLISGKPYTVRFTGGEVRRSDEWLTELLVQHRAAATGLAAN